MKYNPVLRPRNSFRSEDTTVPNKQFSRAVNRSMTNMNCHILRTLYFYLLKNAAFLSMDRGSDRFLLSLYQFAFKTLHYLYDKKTPFQKIALEKTFNNHFTTP